MIAGLAAVVLRRNAVAERNGGSWVEVAPRRGFLWRTTAKRRLRWKPYKSLG